MEPLPRNSPSPAAEVQRPDSSQTQKISAYYSLVFPEFTFYIQTLSVTIGRRCNTNFNIPSSSSSSSNVSVDVDLGAVKSVSRLHAKIEYDSEEDRFVLLVLGRNGAWVDGVWSGSGKRAPLGERSQIQIASRIFHFVLPPPPPEPEVEPSPSSPESTHHRRSPSVDVTSISPPSSLPSQTPPPKESLPLPPLPDPQISPPVSEKPAIPATSKKRKKSNATPPVPPVPPKEKLKPEVMPPKPPFTYAQLIYRAIKARQGKATLHEVCTWVSDEYDYYRFTDGNAWMSSIRHNLSSNRAFKKMERCGGERGKGFFWSLDEDQPQALEELELKSTNVDASNSNPSKDGKSRKKDKGAPLSEPPLKRSIKGDTKGPLPPPLTTAPLQPKNAPIGPLAPTSSFSVAPAAFTYNAQPSAIPPGSDMKASAPVANTAPVPLKIEAPVPSIPAEICIPILRGPVPEGHPQYTPGAPNNAPKDGYIILYEKKLILDPIVFAEITDERMHEIEKMGAKVAIQALTTHLTKVMKERRSRERRNRGRGRGGPSSRPTGRSSVGASLGAVASTIQPSHPPPPADSSVVDAESPFVVVDDSDDEAPASKRQKLLPTVVV